MINISIQEGKKVYFASDFHLGVPNFEESLAREKKIIRWMSSIQHECEALFLVGDIFDFWFEYRHCVPKHFIRIQAKIAEFTDAGIDVHIFGGNHDMWMFNYFQKELGVKVYHEPVSINISGTNLMVGHGDGLGPGDHFYKFLKKVFASNLCQWLFGALHPDLGIKLATGWSGNSRSGKIETHEQTFHGDNEWLYQYCLEQEKTAHHDYYIFGHRHLPLEMKVNDNSTYINLGEWINYSKYCVFDNQKATLLDFE